MNIVGIDCEHECDETMAKEALQTLVHHYPGHDWQVAVKGGIFHVKALNIHPAWGMCLHYSQVKDDAADRAKSLMRSAGEFLERAGQRRGAVDGHVTAVEGVPDKHMARAHL